MQFLYLVLKSAVLGTVLTWCAVFYACGQPQNIIDTSASPVAFAPGVVSMQYDESVASFTPDGNTVYFCQYTVAPTICFSKQVSGKWQRAKVAAFSGQWNDWDPFLSPDGKRLFFVSNRPTDSASANNPQRKSHLWFTEKTGEDKWSGPRYINEPFNLDGINDYAPSVSNSGTLCFFSPGRDKGGKRKSYYARWAGGRYGEIKELALNGDNEVADPCIAPDESYIIFVSGNDLYISYRQSEGWGAGQKLGPQVNNGDNNSDPTISPDGKTLYYASSRLQGFYKRDRKKAFNYDELTGEMESIFNGRSNILMIPVNISAPSIKKS